MSRAKAREVAMKQLYADEMGGECTYIAALQAREEEDDTSRSPSPTDELFAAQLFQGILDNINGIDPYIMEQSRGWSIERIASIERIILRMAIFEMKFSSDEVPVSAIINEAVNMAKKYGSNDRSGAYVNGVLGGISRRTGEPPLPLDVQKAMAEEAAALLEAEEEAAAALLEAEEAVLLENVDSELSGEAVETVFMVENTINDSLFSDKYVAEEIEVLPDKIVSTNESDLVQPEAVISEQGKEERS